MHSTYYAVFGYHIRFPDIAIWRCRIRDISPTNVAGTVNGVFSPAHVHQSPQRKSLLHLVHTRLKSSMLSRQGVADLLTNTGPSSLCWTSDLQLCIQVPFICLTSALKLLPDALMCQISIQLLAFMSVATQAREALWKPSILPKRHRLWPPMCTACPFLCTFGSRRQLHQRRQQWGTQWKPLLPNLQRTSSRKHRGSQHKHTRTRNFPCPSLQWGSMN